MPSKSSRVASKQGSLKRKKRREKGAGQEFDSGPTEAQVQARDEDSASEVQHRPESTTNTSILETTASRQKRRSKQATVDGTPLSYPNLGSELLRIGIVASGILIVLGAATFTIGS